MKANLSGVIFGDNERVKIIGALNVSPESFYKYSDRDRIREDFLSLSRYSDIIDVGAASTAPGVEMISKEEELKRIELALKEISEVNPGIPISVDTQRGEVAELALNSGADIVNDVSGLKDEEMLRVIEEFQPPLILMASKKKPGDCLSIEEIIKSLKLSLDLALERGCNEILVDPGIGFGKPLSLNIEIIRCLPAMRCLGRPILVGISRKSFIGEITGKDVKERLWGSLAATSISVFLGAHGIRTHDPEETRDCVKVSEEISRGYRSIKSEIDGHEISLIEIALGDHVKYILNFIGVDEEGIEIMSRKAKPIGIFIDRLSTPEALICKQEILSLGGDAGINKGCIDFETSETGVLLIGSFSQLKLFSERLKRQGMKLRELGKIMEGFLNGEIGKKEWR